MADLGSAMPLLGLPVPQATLGPEHEKTRQCRAALAKREAAGLLGEADTQRRERLYQRCRLPDCLRWNHCCCCGCSCYCLRCPLPSVVTVVVAAAVVVAGGLLPGSRLPWSNCLLLTLRWPEANRVPSVDLLCTTGVGATVMSGLLPSEPSLSVPWVSTSRPADMASNLQASGSYYVARSL